MASIQELYIYPFHGQNQGETWDKGRRMQQWARPMEPGEDPNEVVQFETYVPKSAAGTEAIRVGFYMTKQEASQANIIKQDDPDNKAQVGDDALLPYWNEPPMPIPMRELAPNESLRNTPAGLVLTVS